MVFYKIIFNSTKQIKLIKGRESLQMEKSSILTKAGHDVIKSNVSLQLQELNEEKSNQSIINIKSQTSANWLQDVDHSNQQRNPIETKYIDESGRFVDPQIGRVVIEEGKSQIIKKQKGTHNKLVQQPIIEKPDHKENQHIPPFLLPQISQYYQPIKTLSHNKKPTSNTLLKNYMKSTNNYETQLQQLSKMKHSHRRNLQQSKHSYLTNSSGLAEEDFYRVDYNNSGMYGKRSRGLMNQRLSKQTARFFNQESKREFDQIEDILSDIKVLSEKQEKPQYSSARLFSKGELSKFTSPSSKKYNKGGKIELTFSSRKFSQPSKPSKLDQLLQQYQFAGFLSNSFGQKSHSMVNNDVEKDSKEQEKKAGEMQAEVRRRLERRKAERVQRRKGDRFYQQVRNQIKYGVSFGEKQHSQLFKKQSVDKQQTNNVKQQQISTPQQQTSMNSNHPNPRNPATQMTMIRQAEQQSQLQQPSLPEQPQTTVIS